MPRWTVALAAAMIVAPMASTSHAATAAGPSTATQKNTYMFGLKCYVANAVSASDTRFNPNGSRSAGFRAMGEKSYNVIWTMGRAIGNSDALIQEDIDSYQNLYRDTYLRDDKFFLRVRYECGRVGLM